VSFVGKRGGVDDGGGDIIGRPERGRKGYLREDGLDLGCDEDIFDERRDDGALADSIVTAKTYPDWAC
jgi:hypothetical protein